MALAAAHGRRQALGPHRAVGPGLAGRVYVLLGDGEINAGVIWEGAHDRRQVPAGQPDAILDYNGIQQTGATADVMPTEPICRQVGAPSAGTSRRFTATTCGRSSTRSTGPTKCTPGPASSSPAPPRAKGVSFMEYDHRWHGMPPNEEQFEKAAGRAGGGAATMAELMIHMRQAYGEALVDAGRTPTRTWSALSADVSNSDFSYMFEEAFPERFFNVGIAEQSLVDVAVGLAYSGKIPFANTFAFLFATRAWRWCARTCATAAPTSS